jgi:predicted transcriptional regulator
MDRVISIVADPLRVLRETMRDGGLSVSEMSRQIGLPVSTVASLVKGISGDPKWSSMSRVISWLMLQEGSGVRRRG